MTCCPSCGSTTPVTALPFIGVMDDGDGRLLALHNCTCGTTRSREVSLADALENLDDDQTGEEECEVAKQSTS